VLIITPGLLKPGGDNVLLRSALTEKRTFSTSADSDIEIGGKIPSRTIAQVQAEVKRERDRVKQAAEAALAAEKERIRRARLAARMQEAGDIVAKERAEQLVEATRQRAVKLLNGETPSTASRNNSSRGNITPSPYQSWLAAERNAKNVLLESHDEDAIVAAVNRAREKADLAEQSGVELVTAPSSRATSPSGRLSELHLGKSSTKVGILAAAAAAAASSKKRVESPPQPTLAASYSCFKQTDLSQLASGSEALRNQFFEALMSPPAATKVLPNNNELPESPQAPVLLQQQLSLLKEKQANNAALRAQEEARRELEDARRAVAQAFDAANELGEFAPKPVVPIAPQSPIPSGPVATKVAEAFGAAPAESVARKESRDLYGTPSSNYKFLDLPTTADVDLPAKADGVNSSGRGGGGGSFGKMPPPPAGLYPVSIRLHATSTQPLCDSLGPKPVASETVSKPLATSVYGFSSQVAGLPQQDVSKKEKELITLSTSPSLIGSSPFLVSTANISNSLHPMPSALPEVTWDTHGIQSEKFLESGGPFQQHAKTDGL
jgi:hypothetical protein